MKNYLTILLLFLIMSFNLSVQSFAETTCRTDKPLVINYDISNLEPIRVVAVAKTNLCAPTTNIGDCFCAEITSNIKSQQKLIVPSGSLFCGKVSKINVPHRIFDRDGYIQVLIDSIETPQGQKICLEKTPIIYKIFSPYAKSFKRKSAEQALPRITGSSTSIALGTATNLNGGVVYAISSGVSTILGTISGFFTPDYCKTRLQTAAKRTAETSPIGVIIGISTKGYTAYIDCDKYIILNLNNNVLSAIQTQCACSKEE